MSNVEPVGLRLVCPGIKVPVVGEISRLERPNFDFSHKKGLHVCWGMHKRGKREGVLALVDLWLELRRPCDFPCDQRQIFRHAEFLETWKS